MGLLFLFIFILTLCCDTFNKYELKIAYEINQSKEKRKDKNKSEKCEKERF